MWAGWAGWSSSCAEMRGTSKSSRLRATSDATRTDRPRGNQGFIGMLPFALTTNHTTGGALGPQRNPCRRIPLGPNIRLDKSDESRSGTQDAVCEDAVRTELAPRADRLGQPL